MMRTIPALVVLAACSSDPAPATPSEAGVDAAAPLGDASSEGGSASDARPVTGPHLVFVSTTTGAGSTWGAHAGDAICAKDAKAAGLGDRTFVAWISAAGDLAIDRLPDGMAWYVPDAQPPSPATQAFASRAALRAGPPAVAISRLAGGGAAPPRTVWTGLDQSRNAALDCDGRRLGSGNVAGNVGI
ncbi:MAG: hypothetical protein HOO96_41120, partial [Polyangiaceae bacterium]|nr:hypothetical protein [Polyangiaceae bacterium]